MLQLTSIAFKKGTFLFLDGAPVNNYFYIIQTGHVASNATLSLDKKSNRAFGPGDFVGVIPCMSHHSQMENVIAMTDVRCISIKKDQYGELISQNVPVALKIIRTFAKRMREMNEEFTKLTLQSSGTESVSQIFDVAKYYDVLNVPKIAIYAYYWYIKECPKGVSVPFAKKRFFALKPYGRGVHFEPDSNLVRTYPASTMIMSEGQTGSEMFFIQKGQVAISRIIDGSEVVLAVLGEGSMFGEMALLENKPRSASAIARTACTLTVISRVNFNRMVETEPGLITRLTTTLADRLWYMYKQMSNACLSEPAHRVVDMLSLQLEKAGAFEGSYQTNLSLSDLINMCGFKKEMQEELQDQFIHKSIIRIVNDKVFVPNCSSVFNYALLYRRQEANKQKSQKNISR